MSNNVYDILNKIQRWLPAVGIFYVAVARIWSLPAGEQVNETVVAVASFLAAFLEIFSTKYYKSLSNS